MLLNLHSVQKQCIYDPTCFSIIVCTPICVNINFKNFHVH